MKYPAVDRKSQNYSKRQHLETLESSANLSFQLQKKFKNPTRTLGIAGFDHHNVRFCVDRIQQCLMCSTFCVELAHQHPCCWCDIDSQKIFSTREVSRTFGILLTNCKKFAAAGSNQIKSKEFINEIKASLIMAENSEIVLDLIPPTELHLLLGVINNLFKKLIQCGPETRVWPEKLNTQMQPFHVGQFPGTECGNLFKNFDINEWLKNPAHFKLKASLKLSGSLEALLIHVLDVMITDSWKKSNN